jgi:hypothetical protein
MQVVGTRIHIGYRRLTMTRLIRGVAMQIEVFDPAMCCSTGVCGPSVDPALARFAADLDIVAELGVAVRRYNLGQEPLEFAKNEQVRDYLATTGEAALPLVFTDGELRSAGRFPTREELAEWCRVRVGEIPADDSSLAESVAARCCSSTDVGAEDSTDCCAPWEPVTLGTKSDASEQCC